MLWRRRDSAANHEDVVVAVRGRELADEGNLGDGAPLVEGVLDDDAVALTRESASICARHLPGR
jgi:hypothetical protein